MNAISKSLRRRFQFFFANSGWVGGQKAACALSLAKAEAWREEQEGQETLRVRWEDDCEEYQMGDAETELPNEVLCCLVETRCDECGLWTVAASLGGIGDPSRNYARVVEAELCDEIRTRIIS